MRLLIDTWRWHGVPFLLRAGKNPRITATEVLVEYKHPPLAGFGEPRVPTGRGNCVRLRLEPNPGIALAARTKTPGEAFRGDQHELFLTQVNLDEQQPYEQLLEDALAGNGALRPPGLGGGGLDGARPHALPRRSSPLVQPRQLGAA